MTSSHEIVIYDDTVHRAQVIALWEQVFGYDAPHNEPSLALDRKLAVKDDLLFIAMVDGTVVGTIMAGYDGHRGWLYSLAVLPTHRHAGLGRALVQHSEQALRALGCLKLNLQVTQTNAAVVAFYATLGYSTEPRISMGKRL